MVAETIAQAISDIRKKFPDMDGLNEEDVKLRVIERILVGLDWTLWDPGELKKEYRVGKDRADYALNPDLPTAVFIEVKKPAVHLENYERQLLNYCVQQAVNLAVLTNGRTWWLYLPKYEGPQEAGLRWSQKRFSEIDITSGKTPASIQREFERFLTKEKVSSGEALEVAKSIIDTRVIAEIARKEIVETWNNIVTMPSEDLTKLLTESTAGLKALGLKANRHQVLVKEFFQEHRAQFKVSDGGPPPPKQSQNGGNGQRDGKPSSFIFLDEGHSVRSWKQVLVDLCVLIYDQNQDSFNRIMDVSGTKNLYFSRNRDDLGSPVPIGNSGVFAATAGLNAVVVDQRCRKVLDKFGYPEDRFKVE